MRSLARSGSVRAARLAGRYGKDDMNEPTATSPSSAAPRLTPLVWLALGASLAAVTWAYWPNLLEMNGAWRTNPQYSHGYLVPLFAAFLLWVRRDRLRPAEASPVWWGVALLLFAAG